MPTASGFKKKIIEHCDAHGIKISQSRATKIAIRIARRAELAHVGTCPEDEQIERELRILGIYTDVTARDAIREIEKAEALV